MSLQLLIAIDSIAFAKRGGLLPVVAQDTRDGRILMVASVNREALERTLASGDAWYWSTSRDALWCKGETSGNMQRVIRIE
ncbi:MAG: phosphoribosyl-AMP cyclohydrolase, partial [bacterium]|nr:phosphoribosyl-AMP cyclohydrolase [bacterium]